LLSFKQKGLILTVSVNVQPLFQIFFILQGSVVTQLKCCGRPCNSYIQTTVLIHWPSFRCRAHSGFTPLTDFLFHRQWTPF